MARQPVFSRVLGGVVQVLIRQGVAMKRISVLLLLVTAAFAQTHRPLAEYALVLEDPPVAQKAQSRVALQSSVALAHFQKIRVAQSRVLAELARRKVRVASTSQILVNAIFVRVAPQDSAALKSIPGVKIGIIDTGIDQNHPGFRDDGFLAPAGLPAGDTAYTNNKVIVARSYVSMMTDSDPAYSTP